MSEQVTLNVQVQEMPQANVQVPQMFNYDPPTVSVGNTTTLPAGSSAAVTNSGTDKDLVLNFAIPKGDKGDQGDQGEVTTAQLTTALSSKLDISAIKRYPIEVYDDGNGNGYVVYSDNWCEQHGQASSTLGPGFVTVTFLKAFAAEPNVLITMKGSYFNAAFNGQHANNAQTVSTTGFTTFIDGNTPYKNWRAEGYLAED